MPSACGSDDEADKGAPGAEVPPPRLAAADERAYRQIQKSSGDLRAAAIAASYGTSETIVADELRADLRKLEDLHPRDSLLKRLHRRTSRALRALRSASSEGQGAAAQVAATAAIAEADLIDAGLRRYAASNPAANELAPG